MPALKSTLELGEQKMAKPMIIGIHGLANKPKEELLKKWWRQAIEEGLLKNQNVNDASFDFDIVYWAGRLYMNTLHHKKVYHFDELYNEEPYVEAFENTIKRKKDTIWDSLAAAALDLSGETLDTLKARFGADALADWFLGRLLKDLNLYYQDGSACQANQEVARPSGPQDHADRPFHGVDHRL